MRIRGVGLAASSVALLYILLLVASPLPAARLILRADLLEAILNTAIFSSVASLLVLMPAVVLGHASARGLSASFIIVSLTTGIPHTAIGTLLLPVIAALGLVDTWLAIVIGMWIVSLPLAAAVMRGSIASMGVEMEEYLRSMGVKGFRLLWIYVKASPRALVTAALLAWLRSFSELGVFLIVATRPISAGIYIFEYFLKYGVAEVAGASLILAAIGASFIVLLNVVERRA